MEDEPQYGSPSPQAQDAGDEAVEKPGMIRSPTKTLLMAVVIGALTLGALVILPYPVGGQREASFNEQQAAPEVGVADGNPLSGMHVGKDPSPADTAVVTIEQGIEGLSNQIRQGFDSLILEEARTNPELTHLADGIREIQVAIAALRQGNEALEQRVADTQSRLQGIAKELQGLRIASKKRAPAQRKPAASVPPFQLKTIDRWDDADYVAVSQSGHIAFLREGEQCSGWQVVRIDRHKGRIVFRGPDGQDYSVAPER
ncbi:hypothetical protein [Sedimenticola selenatireducens]|uniref:Uncharacterized protein n=1 Tax=Sedimenticola selenatireducens TaxID=191960 RepID=A0A2N6CW19_9GAMM|nr:hypothetical protein [Sedimenticola selenatireducens]PLX61439.1 MAG: hypothetical protein C0630_10960 [Sedimenticola selenatireducens]